MENFDFLNSFLFPYVNWIIFLILAYKMLRKPFLNALAAKRQTYAELMQKASLAKEEAELRNRELKDRLARLDREVEEIKSQARQQAEHEAQGMIKSAEQLVEHLQREARRIAEAEIANAKLELQKEILNQVKIHAVEQLQRDLDGGAHRKLVQQGLGNLKRAEVGA